MVENLQAFEKKGLQVFANKIIVIVIETRKIFEKLLCLFSTDKLYTLINIRLKFTNIHLYCNTCDKTVITTQFLLDYPRMQSFMVLTSALFKVLSGNQLKHEKHY